MISIAHYPDFDFIYSLYMHPEINPYLLYEPMDKVDFQPIFEQLMAKKSLFIYTSDDKPAGMFKLVPMTYRSSHVIYLGGLAVNPSDAGKGLGLKMLQAIIDHCRAKGFLRIELTVAVHNEKAIRLYEKAGFEKEGVLKKYTHLVNENRFVDEVLYSYVFD